MTEYWMLPSTGNDGNGGTSETDAVKTFNVAKGLLSAGDKLWVKDEIDITVQDGASNSILAITQSGTATAPIYIEGYHTSEGDNGVITLDASVGGYNLVISCVGYHYWSFKNCIFTGSTSGSNISASTSDNFMFINCSSENSAGKGWLLRDNCRFINCRSIANTNQGLDADANVFILNSIIYSNASSQIVMENGTAINCLIYDPDANQSNIYASAPETNITNIINCISEGGNLSNTNGYAFSNTSGANVALINNIASDFNRGISFTTDTAALYEWQHCEYNAFYSNNDDVYRGQDVTDQDGSFVASSDPFVDASNYDYRPKIGSELRLAGNDIGRQVAKWKSSDDGDNPPAPDDEEYVSYNDIGAIQAKPIRRRTVPWRR